MEDEFAFAFSDDEGSIASRSEYGDLINKEVPFSDVEDLKEEFYVEFHTPPPQPRQRMHY